MTVFYKKALRADSLAHKARKENDKKMYLFYTSVAMYYYSLFYKSFNK